MPSLQALKRILRLYEQAALYGILAIGRCMSCRNSIGNFVSPEIWKRKIF
jgi:hypothetical protein